jgi:hypothetical protein
VLQKQVIEEFASRFAPGSIVLYLGDTSTKQLVTRHDLLIKYKIPVTEHDKLPDIILLDTKRNWLFLIEVVTTHGPVSPKRYKELERMLSKCQLPRVYVTAFPDVVTFKKYAQDIAWETEAWIAAQPDHMIHFNGTKFLGPAK